MIAGGIPGQWDHGAAVGRPGQQGLGEARRHQDTAQVPLAIVLIFAREYLLENTPPSPSSRGYVSSVIWGKNCKMVRETWGNVKEK